MVTSVMPSWVSDQAVEQPSSPPPTMTTSAVETVSDMMMAFWQCCERGVVGAVAWTAGAVPWKYGHRGSDVDRAQPRHATCEVRGHVASPSRSGPYCGLTKSTIGGLGPRYYCFSEINSIYCNETSWLGCGIHAWVDGRVAAGATT